MGHPDKLPCGHSADQVSVFGDRAKCFSCNKSYTWVLKSVQVIPAHWKEYVPVPASVKKAAEAFAPHRQEVTA